ncbi:DUF1702 family protein [Plantactinospora sp. GCM10030261]|uniref:DUF1702 family protein n=1 Tax=Plantactinospora sp. GCM10030261 TaxID=3273420 RepID=UPI0036140629
MRAWRALRRRILTPDVRQTEPEVRGFHGKTPASRDRLATVGRSFLAGYAVAAEARQAPDAEPHLERIPTGFRGFAYEGAAMAFAMRDGLSVRRGRHVADFLAGRGDRHVYMAYVGVGWAMARLPRPRWTRLHAPDPLLRWLVLDGYGFHQAYFHTDTYVHRRHRDERFRWPPDASPDYAPRVIDQGIGRASWFVAGTDPRELVRIFDRFPAHRRADLYAGAGLAATYAGGAAEDELEWLRAAAGAHRAELAQGAAFAAGARVRAGLVVPHNETATRVFCGTSVDAAARATDEARIGLPDDGDLPAFEIWRRRISDAFVGAVRS